MKAGRKRAFDKDVALDKAMRLFWANGYSGTSISDLTATLGINKPSLYAAFGNKEQLFKASIEHYTECYGEPTLLKLLEPKNANLEERLKAYMLSVASVVTDPALPIGCFFVKSSCESGSEAVPEEITCLLNNMKSEREKTLIAIFSKEQEQGALSQDTDVVDLTSYIIVVLYGIGVLAKNGATMKNLQPVVEIAIKTIFCIRNPE